jgi:hypothetical protein
MYSDQNTFRPNLSRMQLQLVNAKHEEKLNSQPCSPNAKKKSLTPQTPDCHEHLYDKWSILSVKGFHQVLNSLLTPLSLFTARTFVAWQTGELLV